jgi:hypothetical protein
VARVLPKVGRGERLRVPRRRLLLLRSPQPRGTNAIRLASFAACCFASTSGRARVGADAWTCWSCGDRRRNCNRRIQSEPLGRSRRDPSARAWNPSQRRPRNRADRLRNSACLVETLQNSAVSGGMKIGEGSPDKRRSFCCAFRTQWTHGEPTRARRRAFDARDLVSGLTRRPPGSGCWSPSARSAFVVGCPHRSPR